MKKFLSLIVLVIAVAFTSQAEANGAGTDNGVIYDISYDLPVIVAAVDNATAPVTPFSNVYTEQVSFDFQSAVVTVNNKNVGGFDAEVPSNSAVAIVNDSTVTNDNKEISETVSDLTSTNNSLNEYAEIVESDGIGFATNTETVSDSLYPENVNVNSTNTKYDNEQIKANVGKLLGNI